MSVPLIHGKCFQKNFQGSSLLNETHGRAAGRAHSLRPAGVKPADGDAGEPGVQIPRD